MAGAERAEEGGEAEAGTRASGGGVCANSWTREQAEASCRENPGM